jgi:hypothetical protein
MNQLKDHSGVPSSSSQAKQLICNLRTERLKQERGGYNINLSGTSYRRGTPNMQDGVNVPAHSAVLASLPYFEAKLRGDWSGTDWNLNKKLNVHLPCPVNQNVVHAFLKCAYGDVQSLHQIESSDAPFLQVGFRNLDISNQNY